MSEYRSEYPVILTPLSGSITYSLLLLLLLSRFSRVRLCATPEKAAHQALLSLGFSRQEHRSGLPFPSPMYESKKWKGSCSVMSDFKIPWTAAHQAPPSMGFSKQEYWSGVPLPSLHLFLTFFFFFLFQQLISFFWLLPRLFPILKDKFSAGSAQIINSALRSFSIN